MRPTGWMRRFFYEAVKMALFICAIFSCFIVLTILGFLSYFMAPVIVNGDLRELLGTIWNPASNSFGIVPMFVGSVCVSFTAVILAYPVATGLSLYCNGMGPHFLGAKLTTVIEFMVCVPTVVYAFVSAILLAPMLRSMFQHGSGFSWLTASLTLTLLVLPTIFLMINTSIREASHKFRVLALSLGMTQAQALAWVITPQAKTGFKIGLILGLARAVGDTIISLMLAGNAAQFPDSTLDSVRTLTAHIALVVATDPNSLAYQSIFLCGLLLCAISAITNLGLRMVSK